MAVLTNAGKQWLVNKMLDVETGKQQYIGWGVGTTTGEDVANAALQTEVQTRVTATLSSPSARVYRAEGTLTADTGRNISEVGLFDATTGGDMAVRALFTAIPLVNGDQIRFTIDITIV